MSWVHYNQFVVRGTYASSAYSGEYLVLWCSTYMYVCGTCTKPPLIEPARYISREAADPLDRRRAFANSLEVKLVDVLDVVALCHRSHACRLGGLRSTEHGRAQRVACKGRVLVGR